MIHKLKHLWESMGFGFVTSQLAPFFEITSEYVLVFYKVVNDSTRLMYKMLSVICHNT